VLETSDGVRALAIFREHEAEIALLLTDVQMPEMGGVELARQVVLKRPDIAVLFISGLCDALPKELSRHCCIRKPFVPSEIIERVAQLVPTPQEREPKVRSLTCQ
jgi:CheY-like chemotaxis protein